MPPQPPSRLLSSSRLPWAQSHPICPTCIHSFHRLYASQATATVESIPAETTASTPTISHKLLASVILSRPPVITQDQHPFEKAFYLYQRRLNERTALPFTRFFYYNEGTPSIVHFRRGVKERKTVARDIGEYNAYGREGWNDEVLLGAKESEPEEQLERILKDEMVDKREGVPEGQVAMATRPMSRLTEADERGDERSLDRTLQKTLYLLVQNKDGNWRFPEAPLDGRESLKTAAGRILEQTAGVDMNTWIVGNHPIGHLKGSYKPDQVKTNDRGHLEQGEMVFFMKGRIMAGQANLENNALGAKDFKWLAKDEIKSLLNPWYWSRVQDMLPER